MCGFAPKCFLIWGLTIMCLVYIFIFVDCIYYLFLAAILAFFLTNPRLVACLVDGLFDLLCWSLGLPCWLLCFVFLWPCRFSSVSRLPQGKYVFLFMLSPSKGEDFPYSSHSANFAVCCRTDLAWSHQALNGKKQHEKQGGTCELTCLWDVKSTQTYSHWILYLCNIYYIAPVSQYHFVSEIVDSFLLWGHTGHIPWKLKQIGV